MNRAEERRVTNRIEAARREGRNPLSLAHLSMIDVDHLTLIKAAEAGGFDGVGLRIVAPPHTPLVREILHNRQAIAEVKAALRETGIAVSDVETFALRPDTRVADYRAGLELAADLGTAYVMTSGVDPDPERTHDNFLELCDLSAEFGLSVGIEFIAFRELRTLAEARALVERSGRANAGIVIDALHLSRSGGTPDQVASLPTNRVCFVQLCDAVAQLPAFEDLAYEARNDRLLPGDGSLWLGDLVKALPDGSVLGIEAPTRALAGLDPLERGRRIGARSREFLRTLDNDPNPGHSR